LSDLHRAIAARRRAEESALARLTRRRRTLERQIASVSAEIEAVEGRLREAGATRRKPGRPKGTGRKTGRPRGSGRKAAATRRPRARRGQKELAIEVLREAKKPMHQAEIARVLRTKKGVKTKSKAFDRSLGLMMSQDERFKKVKRAVYALR
jgi:hypothetical protein